MGSTLIVSLSYPADEADPSGHFVRHQALELARAGDEVRVVAPRVPHGDRAYTSTMVGGDALFAWPGAIARARARPWRLATLAPLAARMRSACAGRFDRAYVHWLVPTAWPLAPRIDAAHAEAIAHGADVRLLLALPRAAREAIVVQLLHRVDSVRFVATALREHLASAIGPKLASQLEARSTVAPMDVDTSDVAAPIDPPPHYVVWVGRDIPTKRLDVAIDACARANRQLVVVGASRKPSDGVRFVGKVPRREALGWIASADVLLSTSIAEAAPTAVREARALGVRVLACPAGDLARWAQSDPHIELAPTEAHLIHLVRSSPGSSAGPT